MDLTFSCYFELSGVYLGFLRDTCDVSHSGVSVMFRMLDDFSHEMENTHSRLDNVMKKLAKVSHMTSGESWRCANLQS